jgi:hypothetical protein
VKGHYQQHSRFWIDNIFVIFGGRVFQQKVGIPMGTNGAPLLADLFLSFIRIRQTSYRVSQGKRKEASQFLPFLAQGICIFVDHFCL